jgi:CheY-like chemotaxis protein
MDQDKKKILLVDDDVTFTRLVKLYLEETDRFEVRVENKGLNGLHTARAMHPDLILLDIVMPDREGSEIASDLKSDPVTDTIPIVFMTGTVVDEELPSDGRIGGYPFLAKPVRMEELLRCIEENIRS